MDQTTFLAPTAFILEGKLVTRWEAYTPPPEQLTRLNEVVAIPIRKARELLANMEKDTTIQTYVYGLEYAGVTRLLLVNPQCSIPKETILEESRKAMNANPFVLYTNETAGKALLKAFNSLMET